MPKDVEIEELRPGEGAEVTWESVVRVRYDGYLNRGDPFQTGMEYTIDLRAREVVAGLRYGLPGMREGGRRRIRAGPHLAYGERGVPGVIPPNAVLIFEVELLEVLSGETTPATGGGPAVLADETISGPGNPAG